MKTDLFIPFDKVRVTKEQFVSLWTKISDYNLPFGTDYLRYKMGWSDAFGSQALAGYKRFAFIANVSKDEVTPSHAVDEVWHYHILHTKSYKHFSNTCGYFLDHNPGMPNEQPRFNGQYIKTLELYREIFREEPVPTVWPRD